MDSRSTFLHLSQGFKRMCSRRTVERANGYPAHAPEGAGRAGVRPRKSMRPRCREKASDTERQAVPKPTQVGGYKHTKARGRNLVKELGNMAP